LHCPYRYIPLFPTRRSSDLCMATWKIPGFAYILFDEERAREFVKTEYESRHLEAYDLCNHPAMKSDLFRLAYLYRHGGIFVDSEDRKSTRLNSSHSQISYAV